MTKMHASLVPLQEIDEDFLQQWRHLVRQCIEPNPFFDPIMTLAASSLPGSPDVELLAVRNGTELCFLMPVLRMKRYRRVPASVLRTWKHDYSSLGNPLLAPNDPVTAVETALRLLRKQKIATVLVLESFAVDGAVADAVYSALKRLDLNPTSLLTHTREAVLKHRGPDEVQHGLSSSTMKAQRKKQARLARKLGGDVGLTEVPRGPELDSAIEQFLRAEASGWKGEDGGAMASRPGHADFLRTICQGFAAEGSLQFKLFGSTEMPVAYFCNFIAQGRVFGFKMAYDDEYRQFSPGAIAELELLTDFYSQTELTSIDSCRESKFPRHHQLFPDTLTISTLVIPLGVRGRVVARSIPIANAAGRRLREWNDALRKRMSWKKPR